MRMKREIRSLVASNFYLFTLKEFYYLLRGSEMGASARQV